MSSITKKEKSKPRNSLFALIAKQIISASICFAFVLGMQNCGNTRLLSYAHSLGLALRYDTDLKAVSEDISSWFKSTLPISSHGDDSNDTDNQILLPITDDITFQ